VIQIYANMNIFLDQELLNVDPSAMVRKVISETIL
jgi:hypothetical protein